MNPAWGCCCPCKCLLRKSAAVLCGQVCRGFAMVSTTSCEVLLRSTVHDNVCSLRYLAVHGWAYINIKVVFCRVHVLSVGYYEICYKTFGIINSSAALMGSEGQRENYAVCVIHDRRSCHVEAVVIYIYHLYLAL